LVAFAEAGRLQEQLDPPADVLDLGEGGLAHHPLGQHPARQRDPAVESFQRFPGPAPGIAILVLQVAGEVAAAEVVGERHALRAQRGQFRPALGDQCVLVGGLLAVGLGLGHGALPVGWIGWMPPVGGWRWRPRRRRPEARQTASLRLAPASRPALRLASTNSSRSPSSTFWVSLRSIPVRRSLIRLWSST